MGKEPRNLGASVRARLLNLARERGQVLDLLLTRYALERLLYRLSISQHRNRFALKGAMLVTTWFEDPHRPTRDLDLLGFGESSSEAMRAVWKEICEITANDGITFDGAALNVTPIREDMEYGGVRLRTTAALAGAPGERKFELCGRRPAVDRPLFRARYPSASATDASLLRRRPSCCWAEPPLKPLSMRSTRLLMRS